MVPPIVCGPHGTLLPSLVMADETHGEAPVADATDDVERDVIGRPDPSDAGDLNDAALRAGPHPDPSDAGDLNDAHLRGDGVPTPPEPQDHSEEGAD